MVPRDHRRQPLPHRRHVVANRNWAHHADAAAGRDRDQAGIGDASRFPGIVPDIVTMEGKPVPDGSGGFLVIKAALAGNAADGL